MQMIADEVGVSRMAVSLALRNSPKISRAMRQRIQETAERLAYRPNPLVRALMTQLHDFRRAQHLPTTIAYLTSFPTRNGWRRPGPFVEFFEGAKQRAEALGYQLEEWWTGKPGSYEKRLSEILSQRHIFGVLVAPLPEGGGTLTFDWASFATSTIAYSLAEPAINRASNDQYQSITMALAELAKLGYRRMGLAMTMEQDVRVQRKWSAGFLVYQQDIPSKRRVPALLVDGTFKQAFVDWYKEHRPDVVLTQEPRCAEYLRDLGLRVPQDVGVAHMALTDADEGFGGINQNARLVGASAIDLVDAQLRRNERGLPGTPKTVLIQGRWVNGPTIRAAKTTVSR
jgi:LacI family transcriptional regulator